MSEPTDADRRQAAKALASGRADEMFRTATSVGLIERIAIALAEERVKARAPFERLAAEMDELVKHYSNGPQSAAAEFADRIRRATEEQQ